VLRRPIETAALIGQLTSPIGLPGMEHWMVPGSENPCELLALILFDLQPRSSNLLGPPWREVETRYVCRMSRFFQVVLASSRTITVSERKKAPYCCSNWRRRVVIEKWSVEYNTKKPHSALGSKSIFTAHGCDIKTLSLLLGLKPWLDHADTNEIAGNYPATPKRIGLPNERDGTKRAPFMPKAGGTSQSAVTG
jgi:hypothetical protein